MAEDGKVRIKAELDAKDLQSEIKEISDMLKNLGGISPIFGKLGRSFDGIGKSVGAIGKIMKTTTGKIVAGVGVSVLAFNQLYEASKRNFSENFQECSKVVIALGNTVVGVASEIVGALASIGGAPTGISDIITRYADFTHRMQEVKAITNATNQEFNAMNDLARKLGRDTVFSALEVADALKSLSMSGMEVTDSMNALAPTLRLAQVAGIELGDAATVVADNITALGMASTDVGDVVDMMVATITNSNTNMSQFAESLSYSSQIAGSLGVSFEDLALATSLMANAGLRGSRSGTAMRTMLTNLSAPTESAAKAMANYGISIKETSDGTMDLDATMRNMRDSLANLPLKEQAKAAKDLFGKTGLGGGLAIINATDEAYNDLQKSITRSTERMTYWENECKKAGL
ncbi:MAG: phage tail tape measure protein, partial [Peptostreptococcaceae bacterium]